MFQGFQARRSEDGIAMRVGGDGPPLLLLHGYPQTHVMWHGVAPHLAREFTVVVADLPGYGDSEPPQLETDHAPHSNERGPFEWSPGWQNSDSKPSQSVGTTEVGAWRTGWPSTTRHECYVSQFLTSCRLPRCTTVPTARLASVTGIGSS